MTARAAPVRNALRRRTSATGIVAVREGALIVHRVPVRSSSSRLLSGRIASPKPASAKTRVLAGGVRPLSYTGFAMFNFCYAERVLQQPASVTPNAFIVPVSKTPDWWRKDWMERHTYFLPRYDDSGQMRSQGHALAAERGIPCLLRRTYQSLAQPARNGDFDFISYFECADADVPVFHDVCGALRDVTRNPEWAFVREGPTWHGRRAATWAELFT